MADKSTKIYLTNPEITSQYASRLSPLVQNLPFNIRERLGRNPYIKLNRHAVKPDGSLAIDPALFSQLGIKIWHVIEDGLRFHISFALSGHVVNGQVQPRPTKGGTFNFNINGWTTINYAADRPEDGLDIDLKDVEVEALSGMAEWCRTKTGDMPHIWWNISDMNLLVLAPVLKLDVPVKAKDSAGKEIPDGKGGVIYETRDFLSWSFMYQEGARLNGNGISSGSHKRADLEAISDLDVGCLV